MKNRHKISNSYFIQKTYFIKRFIFMYLTPDNDGKLLLYLLIVTQ